jgi:hypothetical protein
MNLLENAKALAFGLASAKVSTEETTMTLLEQCKRLDYSPDQPRDELGRFGEGGSGTTRVRVHATGNTFEHKEKFKSAGFHWNQGNRVWEKEVDLPNAVTEERSNLPKGHPDRSDLGPILGGKLRLKGVELYARTIRAPVQEMRLHKSGEVGIPQAGGQPTTGRSSVAERNSIHRGPEGWARSEANPRGVASTAEHNWRVKHDPDYL